MDCDEQATSSNTTGGASGDSGNATREQVSEQRRYLQETLVQKVDDELREVTEARTEAPSAIAEMLASIVAMQQKKFKNKNVDAGELDLDMLMEMANEMMGGAAGGNDENEMEEMNELNEQQAQASNTKQQVGNEVKLLENLLKSANQQMTNK